MRDERVIVVHLRRPKNASDMRDDPFWEFGSFGITGCHAHDLRNLMAGEAVRSITTLIISHL